MIIILTNFNGVVSYQGKNVWSITDYKAKLVGLKDLFNTFDISELVYEEADETYGHVTFGSESW
jgi:hypothetical protein